MKKGRDYGYPPLRPLTEDEREVVMKNLGLARKQAHILASALVRRFYNAPRKMFWQFYDEFIDAGWVGLCIAAQRHDPTKGKFSTFAWTTIKGQICTAERIAELRWGTNKSTRRNWITSFANCGHQPTKESNYERDGELDVWDDRDKQDEEDDSEELRTLICLFLEKRQARIVWLRIVEDWSLERIGEAEGGISRERVRQIQDKAMDRLRRNSTFMKLIEKRAWRRRQRLNFDDFFGTGIAVRPGVE